MYDLASKMVNWIFFLLLERWDLLRIQAQLMDCLGSPL